MRHDWLLDVLTDLHAYACQNGLPGVAEKVEAALDEALREICDKEEAAPLAFRRPLLRGRPN